MTRPRDSRVGITVVVLGAALGLVACSGCRGSSGSGDAGATTSSGVPKSAASTPSSAGTAVLGAARPGMVFVPPGTLRAGTAPDKAPRVADEELPGTATPMGGFYIDVFPYPNEPGAIQTSNVTRDEAEQLCVAKGKRLCTELEWERACKGPDAAVYEYGDVYRPQACDTGVAGEQAARRPSGERPHCKSGFGVFDMHGGAWEWTSSSWNRGSKDASLSVLRGGNAAAGELVGRCANAIARSSSKKSPTMGLRCCAGPKNDAEVHLEARGTLGLVVAPPETTDPWKADLVAATVEAGSGSADAQIDPKWVRVWTWTPVANDALVLVLGCTEAPRTCAMVVGRGASGVGGGDAGSTDGGTKKSVLAKLVLGKDLPELARVGDARHLRMRSLDVRGTYSREVTYVYGRVELGDVKRP